MISISEFEDELTATLVEKERGATPSTDFAQRLLATRESPGRPWRRVGIRGTRRWAPPLLAALTIAVVAVVAWAVASSPSAHRPSPAVSKPAVPTPHVASPTVIRSTGAPPGFHAHGMYFLDPEHGWAVGNAQCAAKSGVCATMLKTVDGGSHWTQIGVPKGLVPVDDGNGVPGAGSCGSNGGIRGPCVDQVLFTDETHGYAWSHNFFYWTTDGGATWRNGHSRADYVARVGNDVFRARPVADCSTCLYRIERARIGSSNWQDVTPGHRDQLRVSLLAAGDTLYATAGAAHGDLLYRSSDLGASWQQVSWPCAPSENAAADGSFACVAEQPRGIVRAVSAAGQLGKKQRLPVNPADVYVLAPTRFVAAWEGVGVLDGRFWTHMAQGRPVRGQGQRVSGRHLRRLAGILRQHLWHGHLCHTGRRAHLAPVRIQLTVHSVADPVPGGASPHLELFFEARQMLRASLSSTARPSHPAR